MRAHLARVWFEDLKERRGGRAEDEQELQDEKKRSREERGRE